MSPPPSPPILLVDGYNIIGFWAHLRKQRDLDGLEAARRALSEELLNYSAFHGLDTRLVFDAYSQYTPLVREKVTDNLSVYYTDFGQTADSFIEKTCASLRQVTRNFKQRLIVATSDRAQQLTVIGYGAEWLSAEQLGHEVQQAARRAQRHHQPRQKKGHSLLKSSLDAESQRRLTQLLQGL